MDFLQSLNVDDLPEQQTRTSRLEKEYPNFDLKVGFDCCCTCGKPSPKTSCSKCRRVLYCSDECRRRDADSSNENEDEQEQAMGHSSVICALLALCNDDEAVDGGDEKEMASLNADRQRAAEERVASEYESYPATISNAISDIPCFRDVLQRCRRKMLDIHVVGASDDSELWGDHPNKKQRMNVWKCYAEALAELAENFGLNKIHLRFVGPDCSIEVDQTIDIPPVKKTKSISSLHITTSKQLYQPSQSQLPDIVIFFNPGFTCPDYNWEDTVSFMKDASGMPYLVTTNTELEAIADLQYLWDRDLIERIPPGLLGLFEGGDGNINSNLNEGKEEDDDEETEGANSFLSVNPFCGMRVRQNGTMANDLYVKSRWIFGGLAGSPNNASSSSKSDHQPAKKKAKSATSKKHNPALV